VVVDSVVLGVLIIVMSGSCSLFVRCILWCVLCRVFGFIGVSLVCL